MSVFSMDIGTAQEVILTGEEIDIFQEVMNIAFGQASADLAEILDAFVVLNVPEVRMLDESALPDLIREGAGPGALSIIEQSYWGKLSGKTVLFFPASAREGLARLFGEFSREDALACAEKEIFLEAGNFIAGGCIARLANCLDDLVTYTAPRSAEILERNADKKTSPTLRRIAAVKIPFSIDKHGVSGLLILTASHESIPWLKTSLKRFMEQYG
ncbi:MAG: hypothetical protein A2X99_04300 [Deltaproteobacteria bacterium GWB2_55_19]|nr:MAG: hypothetical protein A2X99_04300 [Deltaproteobacteria bacterium GWB2_55_19]HAO92961.1 hypothetical protein [Deltaproteobacteria bacterium]